jgi:hypothetical protein
MCCVVVVCIRLRSDKNDAGYSICPHPDNVNNDKYTLCVSGIQYLYDDLIDKSRIKGCYIWMDYSCIDQDLHDLISVDYKNMEEIMSVSDCVFTPAVDPGNTFHDLVITGGGYLKDYKVLDWTGSEHSNRGYLKRGWCVLEMFYAVSKVNEHTILHVCLLLLVIPVCRMMQCIVMVGQYTPRISPSAPKNIHRIQIQVPEVPKSTAPGC